jgi:hypothetical protein
MRLHSESARFFVWLAAYMVVALIAVFDGMEFAMAQGSDEMAVNASSTPDRGDQAWARYLRFRRGDRCCSWPSQGS